MAELVLFHDAPGRTAGGHAAADAHRAGGHVAQLPDPDEGRTPAGLERRGPAAASERAATFAGHRALGVPDAAGERARPCRARRGDGGG